MLAYLLSKWTVWAKSAIIRSPALAGRRRIPRVEFLEERWVPSTIIAEYPIPTQNSSPYGITTGPKGNLWFTEYEQDQIGVINPATQAVSEYPIPTAYSGPLGITLGPDGDLWFTEFAASQIGRINPTTDAVTEFTIPTAKSYPSEITVGPDGNLWFTEFGTNKIGEINPTTHAISEFSLPTADSDPLGITAGPDGNLWFTESNTNKIGKINPTTHVISEFTIPQASSLPDEITAGPNGNMYFTENSGNAIGVINTTTHAFSVYAVPTSDSGLLSITTGPDGNIWFTENIADAIGEVDLASGDIIETTLDTANAAPADIIEAPGNKLWFTESSADQIAEVFGALTVTTSPVNQTIVEGQSATFTASYVGFPSATVRWQVSTNGGKSFASLSNTDVYSGVTTDTLAITNATTAMNDYEYRAVFTDGVTPTPSADSTAATLTVKSVFSISPAMPQGMVDESYKQTISVLGSTTPFDVFTVSNFHPGTTGLKASGITTNEANGTIVVTGMPTAVGTASFTLSVANTAGRKLTETVDIAIRPPLSITTSSLPPATAGIDYSQSVNVVGGILPYTTFSVTNFNAGTTGLTASDITETPATGVFKINGTPSAGGTATFTVNVTDSAGKTVTKNFSMSFNPPVVVTPTLPAGTAGTGYKQTLSVTGGGEPYKSLTVNNFSGGGTGLTLGNIKINTTADTVTIAGTPTTAGTVTFTIKVVDAIGAVVNKSCTITINPLMSITSSLPKGTAGATYDQTITVTRGSAPYKTVTVTGFNSGTTGLSAAAITVNTAKGTVVIDGTPSASGTVSFTANVTDAAGSQLTHTYSIKFNSAPIVGNLTTTQWTVNKGGFTGVLSLSGGTGPFTLVGSSGLPTGMSVLMSVNEIRLIGKPSVAQNFAAGSVTIQDAAGYKITKTFSVTINPALQITTTSLPASTSAVLYTTAVHATGGTGTVAFAITAGSLPPGLKLSSAGVITGTSHGAGSYKFTITATDSLGDTVSQKFTLS